MSLAQEYCHGWPVSAFRRPSPGIGALGRAWQAVLIDDLPRLVGDALRDLRGVSLTIQLLLDVYDAGMAYRADVEVFLSETLDVPVQAAPADSLVEHLRRALEEDGEKQAVYAFHADGYFWQVREFRGMGW